MIDFNHGWTAGLSGDTTDDYSDPYAVPQRGLSASDMDSDCRGRSLL